MKVLLVDDSTTIRIMLRRAVLEYPGVETAEAANGVEALAELGRQRYDLVIMDVNMPIMDGLETLEAIRATPAYTRLAVVVLTSEKNESVVRRLVELGITNYLSKPLSQDKLSERLGQILHRLSPAVAVERGEKVKKRGQTILVAEHDPDRRHYLQNVLGPHFKLIATDSGAAAMQFCLAPGDAAVDMVFVGEDIGLPPARLLIPKLKRCHALENARIIACRSKAGMKDRAAEALVDAWLDWSYVPEVFLASLERAYTGVDLPIVGVPEFRASVEHDAASAVEQLFGLMLSTDVTQASAEAVTANPWAGQGIHARIDLTAPGVPAISVVFRADRASASVVAAQLIGTAPEDLADEDVVSTAAEFANIIVGRIRNRLVEAGVSMQMNLPTTWTGTTEEGFKNAGATTLTFNSTRPAASFGLLIAVAEQIAAAA
jgi:two-component system, chemotaxis family, chemotaxis protein CheY